MVKGKKTDEVMREIKRLHGCVAFPRSGRGVGTTRVQLDSVSAKLISEGSVIDLGSSRLVHLGIRSSIPIILKPSILSATRMYLLSIGQVLGMMKSWG